MPQAAKQNFIYLVISEDQRVAKIGRTHNSPAQRLAQLQTGNVSKLELYASVRADPDAEQALQAMLKKYRRTGEWFRHVTMLKCIFCSLEEDEWEPIHFENRAMTAAEVCTSAMFGLRSYLNNRVNGLYDGDPDDLEEMEMS